MPDSEKLLGTLSDSDIISLTFKCFGMKNEDYENLRPAVVASGPELPLSFPGLIDIKEYDDAPIEGSSVKFIPMTYKSTSNISAKVGRYIPLRKRNLVPMDTKKLIQERKVLRVDKIDFGRMDEIKEYVKNNCALTFAMVDLKGMQKTLTEMQSLNKNFETSAVIYNSNERSNPSTGCSKLLLTLVTFIDLPYMIPIYNSKVKGVGVVLNVSWLKDVVHQKANSDLLYAQAVFGDRDDDITTVDGKIVRQNAIFNGTKFREASRVIRIANRGSSTNKA